MECNRDEATRSKEIAERKFRENDIAGARKFALKAKSLFVALEGIDQMISTFDVHLMTERQVLGENDWYGILQVPPLADDETIKKQYRKLALQFHPDKNRAIGADGAFKLISDAWNVLSDKSKRMAYDQKRNRNCQGVQKSTFQANKANSTSSATVSSTAGLRHQKARPAPPTAAPPSDPSKHNTFWTRCSLCDIHFEYNRKYLNHYLHCPTCNRAFVAIEVVPPSTRSSKFVPKPTATTEKIYREIPNRAMPGLQTGAARGCSFPSTAAVAQATTHTVQQSHETVRREQEVEPNAARRAEAKLHRKGINAVRIRVGMPGSSGAATKESEAAKRRRANDTKKVVWQPTSSGPDGSSGVTMHPAKRGSSSSAGTSGAKRRKVSSGDLNCEATNFGLGKVVGQLDVRGILIDKMKQKLRDKLDEFNRNKGNVGKKEKIRSGKKVGTEEKKKVQSGRKTECTKTVNAEEKHKAQCGKAIVSEEKEKGQTSNVIDSEETKKVQSSKPVDLEEMEKSRKRTISDSEETLKVYKKRNRKEELKEQGADAVGGNSTKQHLVDSSDTCLNKTSCCNNSSDDATNEMLVPDADFYKFDNHPISSFQSDQIWAAYDEEDGMPRYYALIQKVISVHPFKIRIAYLEANDSNEFGALRWTSCGLSKTCGDFRVGTSEFTDQLNVFSHAVTWEKGPCGIIRILPKKGDIWALYQNWSPDWNEFTPDDTIYKYELVEVIGSYSPNEGISVTPIVKVPGFVAVFKPLLDSKKSKRIPTEEMLRFSHQVPFHVLTGEEAQNSPKGCYELDPASTPKELLQLVSEPGDAIEVGS